MSEDDAVAILVVVPVLHLLDRFETVERHFLDQVRRQDAMATAVRDEGLDLVLTGLQSDDQGHGQTGVLLAELLDMAHSTVVVDISLMVRLAASWASRMIRFH